MNTVAKFRSWEQAVEWLRGQADQRELILSAYYDDPLIDAATRYWQSDEWNEIRPFLPAGAGKALDIGAGRGIASFALAKEKFSVTALEPDGSALVGAQAIRDLAKDSGLDIKVTQEFSERLPFPDAQFDVVFARAVLHHTSDLKAACREFLRVLKPGGRLIAIREHVISNSSDLGAFLDLHPLHKIYGGENAFLLADYKEAIQAAGFNIDKVLSPFETAMNFAPYTKNSLQREIARRIGGRVPGLERLLSCLFSIGPVWGVAWRLLSKVDHRPGRLYSFIATRP